MYYSIPASQLGLDCEMLMTSVVPPNYRPARCLGRDGDHSPSPAVISPDLGGWEAFSGIYVNGFWSRRVQGGSCCRLSDHSVQRGWRLSGFCFVCYHRPRAPPRTSRHQGNVLCPNKSHHHFDLISCDCHIQTDPELNDPGVWGIWIGVGWGGGGGPWNAGQDVRKSTQ